MTDLSGAAGAAPPTSCTPPESIRSFLGIDCGGTNTKLLLAGEAGDGLAELRAETHRTPADGSLMENLAGMVRDFLGNDAVAGVGVSVPGLVAPDGIVTACSNLPGLVGTDPAAWISGGVAAETVNDGVAAAMAEAQFGAGRGSDDLFVYALGTGIAGAHVLNGRIRRGAHGGAYEVGHLGSGAGRVCSCGQRGCLETEIGDTWLGLRWDEARGTVAGSRAIDVTDAARNGDRDALVVLDRATTALARNFLTMASLLDPGMIVVGGGLASSADLIVEPAVRKLESLVTFQTVPQVRLAELGRWGGAWGAALAAQRVLGKQLVA